MRIDKKVSFDICTYCNHKCTFCSNSDPRTIKDQTSLVDFRSVMKNVTRYVNITELGLSAKGEVLVNKEFEEIVRSSKEDFHIPYVYFSTNGALLTRERAIDIIEAGVDRIKFSINAVNRDVYNSVHLVDDFDLVIENLKELLKLKKEKYPKLKVTISSVISMQKTLLRDEFKKLIGEDFELIDGISVYAITYTPKFEEVSSEVQPNKKCYIPFNELYINSDGSLGLCCKDYFDSVNFGSLKDSDYVGIFNSHAFRGVRAMHKKSEFPDGHLCKSCLLYSDD